MTPARRPVLTAVRLLPAALIAACLWPQPGDSFGAGGLSKLEPPRAQALGGAGTAVESDPFLVLVNPAAAARVPASTLGVGAQTDWTGGVSGTMFGLRTLQHATFTVGALYRNAGLVTLNASDGTSRQVVAGTDLIALASMAGTISPNVTLGFSIQGYHSELAEAVKATAIMADAGIQVRVLPTLKIGACLKHVGTAVKYLEDGIAPPTEARAGAAWVVPVAGIIGDTDHLLVIADAAIGADTRVATWRGGLEYWWRNLVILRGGGRLASVALLGQVAAGIGLRVPFEVGSIRECRLDYCVRLLNAGFGTPQNLSLAMVF